MQTVSQFSELVEMVYATVENPETGWEDFLKLLFVAVNSHMGAVTYFLNNQTKMVLLGSGERAQYDYRR